MSGLFIDVLNMSLNAACVAAVVMLVRLVIRKAPKKYAYMLWAVVFFRLVCPFTLELPVSAVPVQPQTIPQDIVYAETPAIQSGLPAVDNAVNAVIENTLPPPSPTNSISFINVVLIYGAFIWLTGVIVLVLYAVISYIALKRRVGDAIRVEGNIYETDRIQTPFVLGFIRPKIYIPTGLGAGELEYIIMHERTHIRRFDYLLKPLAFLITAVHWFNPLAWVSYALMARDMELSADESVMKRSAADIRGSYSKSLLSLSARHSGLLSPLAFGETGVKERVKNVLNYKKPAFWLSVAAVCVVVAATLLLIGGRMSNNSPEQVIDAKMSEIIGDDPNMASYGSYSMDGIEEIGGYSFAVVNYFPQEGHGSVILFVIRGNTIIDMAWGEPPISLGVAAYIYYLPDIKIVYGAVNDQIWLNPDDAPAKVEFTELQAVHDGEIRVAEIGNHQAFLMCFERNTYIDDLLIITDGNKTISFSDLPISENFIDTINGIEPDVTTPTDTVADTTTDTNKITVEIPYTTYYKAKITFLHKEGSSVLSNGEPVEITDPRIIDYIHQTLSNGITHTDDSLPKGNTVDVFQIEMFYAHGGYSDGLYYDTLYDKAYVVKDGGPHTISLDFARFISALYTDSMFESASVIPLTQQDSDAVDLFKQHGWTLAYKLNTLQQKIAIQNLSEFNSGQYYFAYNNELSKDIGLDMSGYQGEYTVDIYRVLESMPESFYPTQECRGIVVRDGGTIIGAFISAGRHSIFNACSLKGNSFDAVTGKTLNEWFESKVTPNSVEELIVKYTPEQIIEYYFTLLNKRADKSAEICVARAALLGSMTANMPDSELYSIPWLPLTEDTRGKSRLENFISAKVLKIEPADESEGNHKVFNITVDLQYKNPISLSNGEQMWGCTMVYESPQTGWKILSFGH